MEECFAVRTRGYMWESVRAGGDCRLFLQQKGCDHAKSQKWRQGPSLNGEIGWEPIRERKKKKMEKVSEVETGKSWLAAKEEIGVIADWKIWWRSRMEGLEAKIARSSTCSDNRIPGDRAGTNPFTAKRNYVVLSTLPCDTPTNWGREVDEAHLRLKIRPERKDFMKIPMFLRLSW